MQETLRSYPGRALDFDPPAYGEIRRQGLRQYRFFLAALATEDSFESSRSEPALQSQERPEWEAARQRALARLPPPEDALPLRVLVSIAGNLTWGALETFHNQPVSSQGTEPASQGLREWYEQFEDDFRLFFPAEHLEELPEALDWGRGEGESFTRLLLRLSDEFARGSGRRPESALTLGVLLRDFAEIIAPLAEALEFSIDELLREVLLGPVVAMAVAVEVVFACYQDLLERLGPGPQTMFVAFALTDGTALASRWQQEDLFAAAGVEPPGALGLDPGHSVHKHANSDAPTARDELGVAPLVEGLRALLDDRRTELPLSIGLTAPWGGGKSSLMFQLRRALLEPSPGRHRTWIPIRFDAWKFERSERIWAALSRAIYEQSQQSMSTWQRIAFKFRLERRRRSWLGFWGGPVLVVALFIAALALLFLHRSTLPGAIAVVLVLTGAGALLGRLWGLLSDPFKRALSGYTSNPRYEEELGFTTEAEADIRNLTQLLTAKADHVLVVFVDDLDRCSPSHLVEAIEAINQIFNAAVYEPALDATVDADSGERPGRCVFVLGMDREMVAAGIEVAYGETIEKLPTARRRNFGLKFLAKIVQLSVAVPKPEAPAIARLLEGIGSAAKPARRTTSFNAEDLAADDSAPTRRVPPITRDHDLSDLREDETGGLFFVPPIEPVSIDQDSPQFREAEREAVAHLDRNPRDVKRFDNAFRLQLHVAANTPGCELAFDRDDLIAIAKWVALRLRWPEFADACDEDEGLLARIEANWNGLGKSVGRPDPDEERWSEDHELRALLIDSRPGHRIARLQEQTFLRVS